MSDKPEATTDEKTESNVLDDKDKRELLRIARATLREWLSTGYLPPGAPHRKTLLEARGAAVTLAVQGQPRGHAASLDADRPLYLAIEELAVQAASRDPSADPIRGEELADVLITVHVLSAPTTSAADAIDPQRDGVAITKGPRRGLVLPGVAATKGWSREQLLDEACARAALPAGAWREPGTELARFTADSLSEV